MQKRNTVTMKKYIDQMWSAGEGISAIPGTNSKADIIQELNDVAERRRVSLAGVRMPAPSRNSPADLFANEIYLLAQAHSPGTMQRGAYIARTANIHKTRENLHSASVLTSPTSLPCIPNDFFDGSMLDDSVDEAFNLADQPLPRKRAREDETNYFPPVPPKRLRMMPAGHLVFLTETQYMKQMPIHLPVPGQSSLMQQTKCKKRKDMTAARLKRKPKENKRYVRKALYCVSAEQKQTKVEKCFNP